MKTKMIVVVVLAAMCVLPLSAQVKVGVEGGMNLSHYLVSGFYFGYCLTTIFTFRFLVEFIKASQEAFEDSMMLNMGQWLSIPFILLGAHFMYHSFKPVK
jgi:prolipoprotein diacylglyceryltransferase